MLNLALLDQLRNGLVSVFRSPDNGLEFLTYLNLRLPCLYDLVAVSMALSDDAASRLRHLFLEYTDATGPMGSLEYTRGDEDDEDEEDFLYSNLQEQFKNIDYMGDLWDVVGRCRNLESLGLAGTQLINCEAMDWRPRGDGLKILRLRRAAMTYDNIVRLLSSSQGGPSNIAELDMQDVELLDRTWAAVFDFMKTCGTIRYFDIWNLNYDRCGESNHYREGYDGRPWENSTMVWTENEEDRERLDELVKKVVQDGGTMGRNQTSFGDWD